MEEINLERILLAHTNLLKNKATGNLTSLHSLVI